MSNLYSMTAIHGLITLIYIAVVLFIMLIIILCFYLHDDSDKSCDNCGCRDTDWCHICCSEDNKSEWIPKED